VKPKRWDDQRLWYLRVKGQRRRFRRLGCGFVINRTHQCACASSDCPNCKIWLHSPLTFLAFCESISHIHSRFTWQSYLTDSRTVITNYLLATVIYQLLFCIAHTGINCLDPVRGMDVCWRSNDPLPQNYCWGGRGIKIKFSNGNILCSRSR
jgi:hypothetical protein